MIRARRHAQVDAAPAVHLDAVRVLEDRSAPGLSRFVSVRSVARVLDCSTAWVRQWHKAGVLTGYVLHAVPGDRGRLIFLERDVRAFLLARGLPVEPDER